MTAPAPGLLADGGTNDRRIAILEAFQASRTGHGIVSTRFEESLAEHGYAVVRRPTSPASADVADMPRLKLQFSDQWLRQRIAAEPDDTSCEAGLLHPDAPQQTHRAGSVLHDLMLAYERRIRSDCHSQDDLAKEPWRCAEYIAAERFFEAALAPQASLPADVADIRARLERCAELDVIGLHRICAEAASALQSALAENERLKKDDAASDSVIRGYEQIVSTLTDRIGKLETQGLMQAHENATLTAECERLRVDEREACAKIADSTRTGWFNGEATTAYGQAYQHACAVIAAAIRARALQPAAATGGEGT